MSRERELETALRELRRFANRMTDTRYGNEALRYQDLADKALGYCGCPDCSAARDAALGTGAIAPSGDLADGPVGGAEAPKASLEGLR